MMSRYATQPQFREAIGIGRAVASPVPAPPTPPGAVPGRPGAASSPLAPVFPTTFVVPAGFCLVPVPAGLSIPQGMQAWYGLRRVTIGRDTAGELSLFGAEIEMLPPDVDGAANGVIDRTPWGDTVGATAAIVVDINLPFTAEGAWTAAPAHIPGIEGFAGSPPPHTRVVQPGSPGYFIVRHFPPGKFTDTTPAQKTVISSAAPYIMRLPEGSRLDVALVVARTYVHNLPSAKVLVGLADVRLRVGPTINDRDFSQ